jgi:hypothetical protein
VSASKKAALYHTAQAKLVVCAGAELSCTVWHWGEEVSPNAQSFAWLVFNSVEKVFRDVFDAKEPCLLIYCLKLFKVVQSFADLVDM